MEHGAIRGLAHRRVASTTATTITTAAPTTETCFDSSPGPLSGVISRAVTTVEDVLDLLAAPKTSADKQVSNKGVFTTIIGFVPESNTFTPDAEQHDGGHHRAGAAGAAPHLHARLHTGRSWGWGATWVLAVRACVRACVRA